MPFAHLYYSMRANYTLPGAREVKTLDFETLINKSSSAISILNADGKLVYSSDIGGKLLGYTPEESNGKSFLNWLHPDEILRVSEVFPAVLEDVGATHNYVWKCIHKDGTDRYLKVQSTNLINDPEVKGLLCIVSDVTERESRLNAQADLLDMFQGLIKNPYLALMIEDEHCNIISVNHKFCEIFALDEAPESLAGSDSQSNVEKMMDQVVDSETFVERFQTIVSARRPVQSELVYLKDGRILDQGYLPLTNRAGKFIGHIWTYREVTAEQRSHACLRESESRLSAIIENSGKAIFSVDRDLRLTRFNSVYSQAVVDQYDILPTPQAFLPDIEGNDYDTEAYSRVLQGERFQKEVAQSYNGVTHYFRYSFNPIIEEGEVTGAAVFREDITKYKEAEQELIAANRRFYQASRAINASMFEWDMIHNTIHRTAGIEALLGFEEGEIEPTIDWWYCRIFPEDIDRCKLDLEEALASPQDHLEAEYRMIDKWGKIIHVWDRGVISRDANGIPVRIIGCTQNITDRHRMVEALELSEARYKLLFDTNPFPLWLYDEETLRFLEVNDAAIKHYGYTREEFLSLTVLDISTGSNARSLIQKGHGRRGGSFSPVVHTLKNRQEREVEIHYARIDYNGRKARLILSHDITDRLRIERELKRERSRVQAIFNNTDDIVWAVDSDLRVSFFNRSIETFFKSVFNIDLFKGLNLTDHFGEDENSRWNGWLERCRTGERFTIEEEYIHDGTTINMEISFSPVAEDGRITGVAMFGRNITERKRMEELLVKAKDKAEEMNRLKSTFLANMSHEIRTPMTAIIGYANYLAEMLKDEEEKNCALSIERSGYRLMDTINGILDLARIESNKLELKKIEVNVAQELDAIVELLYPLANQKELPIIIEEQVTPIYSITDPHCFGRIMTNLVGNAIKFTDRGGIVISFRSNEHAVFIDVTDTGIGISEDFLPHLFEEFTQQSTGYSRSFEGTGLGLAISKRLAHLLGGDITVKSVAGVGSTFTLSLPIARTQTISIRESSSILNTTVPLERAAKPKILVVEDSDATRELIKLILAPSFEVGYAVNPAEVLANVSTQIYDLIIMDINLGLNLSGLDLTKYIRTLPNYTTTPIIAFTAYAMKGDREEALLAGCDDYLSKPFRKEDLLNKINALLKK